MWKRALAGLALAGIILFLLLRKVDTHQVWTVLRGARWAILPLVSVCGCLSVFLKGERWAIALGAHSGERPRRRVFAATMIGVAANYLLPARLGDILRVLVLRKHNDVPATRGLLASWSSQAFDLLAVAVLLLAGAAAGEGVASGATVALVLAVVLGGVAVVGLLARQPARLVGWANGLCSLLPKRLAAKAQPLVEHAIDGLRFLGKPVVLGWVVLFTVAIWIVEVTSMWLALYAFHIAVRPAAAGLLVAAIGLSFALPLTPGNIGTYQLIAILVLGRFGIERDQAFAFGIGFQAYALVTTVLLGLVLFQREGLSFETLGKAGEAQAP